MQLNNAYFLLPFVLSLTIACFSNDLKKESSLVPASDVKREKALIRYTRRNISKNLPYIQGLLELNGKHTVLIFEDNKLIKSEEVDVPKTDPNVMSLPQETRKKLGGTPLHNAALLGHKQVVELLLHNGACAWCVAQTNYKGHYNAPLHMVVKGVEAQDPVGVVNLLRKNGADPNVGGGGHRHVPLTPLMMLAMQKNWRPKLLGALLAFENLDINKQSNGQGKTALFLAAERDNYKTIQEILIHGADTNILDKRKHAALKVAIDKGLFKTANVLCINQADPFVGKPCAMQSLLQRIFETKKKWHGKRILGYQKLLTNLLAVNPVSPQTKEYKWMSNCAQRLGIKYNFDQALLRAQQKIASQVTVNINKKK